MGGIVSKKQLASKLMFIGGMVELVIATLHFYPMPFQITQAREFAMLSNDYRSIIFLETISVGLCITVFGTLSIYFSKKLLAGEKTVWVFGLSQGILWAGRTIFELILPVKIPLLFLANPTALLLPLLMLLTLLFLVPLLAFRTEWRF